MEAPEVTSALDWIEADGMEFGAAPFSPPGWPYRIGDAIENETLLFLHERFPGYNRITAVNWVDGRGFGAAFTLTPGHRDAHWTYEGHFPTKISRVGYERAVRSGVADPLPSHVNPNHVLGDRFEKSGGAVLDSLDVLRARWHEPFERRYGRDGTP